MADKLFNQFKRKVYNTPKSFLDFIKLYHKAFDMKNEEL